MTTLRDRFQLLRVAGAKGMQHATNAPSDTTARATTVQQQATVHRREGATTRATTTQQAIARHATPAQQDQGTDATAAHTLRAAFDPLRVAGAEECNTQQSNNEVAVALAEVINRACDVRGDDHVNRAALLAECAALRLEGQADMLAHFTVEAARWVAPQPDARVTCNTCAHYRPSYCRNHRAAGLTSPDAGRDLAAMLQDCPGFAARGDA